MLQDNRAIHRIVWIINCFLIVRFGSLVSLVELLGGVAVPVPLLLTSLFSSLMGVSSGGGGRRSVPLRRGGSGSRLHGQAHVVLREGDGRGPRGRHVVQLSDLQAVPEVVVVVEPVEHGRHPPREATRLPHSAQAGLRVSIQRFSPARGVEL